MSTKNKYQNALLSSFLEQVWESRLIFISLSVFELWIRTVDLGLIIMHILNLSFIYV